MAQGCLHKPRWLAFGLISFEATLEETLDAWMYFDKKLLECFHLTRFLQATAAFVFAAFDTTWAVSGQEISPKTCVFLSFRICLENDV